MTMQRHTVHSNPPGGPHALLLGACALLVVLGGVGTASAQVPLFPPTSIFSDNFNSTAAWEPPSDWMDFNWDRNDPNYGDWTEYTGSRSCAQNRWLPATLLENNSDNPDEGGTEGQHLLVVEQSLAGGSILNSDKGNVRIEFDFQGGRASRPGAAWAVTDTNGDRLVDDAYIFYFSDLPRTSQTPAEKASWHLVKRVAGADMEVATGVVDANWLPHYTVAQDVCYKLSVEFSCGYTRVRVKHPESVWLTLVMWFDDFIDYGPTLAPGWDRILLRFRRFLCARHLFRQF